MSKNQISDGLIVLSVIAIVFAIIGAFGYDLWLASTQWVLVAIALATYSLYVKLR